MFLVLIRVSSFADVNESSDVAVTICEWGWRGLTASSPASFASFPTAPTSAPTATPRRLRRKSRRGGSGEPGTSRATAAAAPAYAKLKCAGLVCTAKCLSTPTTGSRLQSRISRTLADWRFESLLCSSSGVAQFSGFSLDIQPGHPIKEHKISLGPKKKHCKIGDTHSTASASF